MFKRSIAQPSDTTIWSIITQQVETDKVVYGAELSRSESELMDALANRKVEKVVTVESRQAGVELGSLKDEINGNNDPAYRLGDAVTTLQKLHGKLKDGPEKQMVSNYLAAAKKWRSRKQTFKFRVDKLPDDGTLYIEVTERRTGPEVGAVQADVRGGRVQY